MVKPGDEILWQGDLLACVAGENEGAVGEGLKAIKVTYEMLDVFVKDDDLAAAQAAEAAAATRTNTRA